MAITPRTILTRPLHLVLFLLGALAVGGLVGWIVAQEKPDGAGEDGARAVDASDEFERDDAQPSIGDAGQSEDLGIDDTDRWRPAGAEFDRRDHQCTLVEPEADWTEAHYLRHLDCMEERDEPSAERLEATDEALEAVGLTEKLAVEKADLLRERDRERAHLAFLEKAVDELDTGDPELLHRLARALTWRGEPEDLERIRHLQLLSRSMASNECEALQTDVWTRYLLAHRFAERPSPAAFDAVREAIDIYRGRDCAEKRHTGKWDALAEVVGVGVAAEQVDGHGAHGALIREVAHSFKILDPERLCERAVPDRDGLRGHCEDRLTDELHLSER